MASLAIELSKLSKSYGGHAPAVDGISCRIGEGERVGIVGRNGAGKSTLLHMIAGVSEPTSGTLQVTGKVTSVMTLGVGLREDLSGRENIYVDGEVHGKAKSEVARFVDRVIDFAELGEFIDMPVRTYSTGMKARLGFALITTIEPEILIIDEALSAGDAAFARKAERAIRQLCDRGRIVIIVSHSMGAVRDMCNRCLWMERGKVVMDGAPEEVTAAYLESVRREDEVRLIERFKRRMGESFGRDGCGIERLETCYAEGDVPAASLQTGRDVAIVMRAKLAPGAVGAAVRLSITRLDGLAILDQTREARFSATGDVDLRVLMRPLLLGAAVYLVAAELRRGPELLASRSTILEVFTDAPPTGGKPALLHQAQASVERARI